MAQKPKAGVQHYLYSDEEADEVLTQTLRHKLDKAGLNNLVGETSVSFDRNYRGARTKLVTINGISNRASVCPVIVQGPSQAIEFAWNVGIGHLTGSGFRRFGLKGDFMYFVIRYSGPFGFIKPWTAVRDGETFSQQFLTPSMIEGIRQKLEVREILRHRLTYVGMSEQQEVTHAKAWKYTRNKKLHTRDRSILTRGVMLEPELFLSLFQCRRC